MSDKPDYNALSLELHRLHRGKISVVSKVPVKTRYDLSIAYTPGVAEPCRRIAQNKDDAYTYTSKGNLIAVITDGSAVLGLGNIGPLASLPVMEGKAVLFKEFADIDAIALAIDTQDVDKFVETVKLISPAFGGINLEDISAPRCFEIEERLKKELCIPLFHDDQHGTAIVVLAGMINAMKLSGKSLDKIKIVFSGVGAAGIACAKMLLNYGAKNIIMVDTIGAIYDGRIEHMNSIKIEMSKLTNHHKETGLLKDVIKGADVFIGVSAPGVLTADMIRTMNTKPIIFAMANPIPEIMPDIAKQAGAFIVATGRSDFANQINNVLAFPGLMRGALNVRAKVVNDCMKIAAAETLAAMVPNPTVDKIIPEPFEPDIAKKVAEQVMKTAIKTGVNRI